MACVDVIKAAEALKLKVEQHAQIVQGVLESLIKEREELNDIIVQLQEMQQDNDVNCNENAYSLQSTSDGDDHRQNLTQEKAAPDVSDDIFSNCTESVEGEEPDTISDDSDLDDYEEITDDSCDDQDQIYLEPAQTNGASPDDLRQPYPTADLSIPPMSNMIIEQTEDWSEDNFPSFHPTFGRSRNSNGCPCCHSRNQERCGCPGLSVQVRSYLYFLLKIAFFF